MGTFMLLASSPLTRQRQTSSGDPNIVLSEDTRIGRGANGPGLLPVNWGQISSNHCRVFRKDDKWYLEDTSTNGTAINGVIVLKGRANQLAEGDIIRLAVATQDPNRIVEYTFGKPPDVPKVEERMHQEAGPLHGSPVDDVTNNVQKQPDSVSPPADGHALQRLHKSNEELRKRLEAQQAATAEALQKAQQTEKDYEEHRRQAQAEMDAYKASVWAQSDMAMRDTLAKLADTEKALKKERLEHAQAKQETARLKTEADKARKTAESVSRERDLMAQQLRTIEERHAGVVQAAKDAEQRAEQEQQRLQKELQRASEAKQAAERRCHDEVVARSTAAQCQEELQREVWELKGKLQSTEDALAGAEERALCSASFAQHSLNLISTAQQQRQAQQSMMSDIQAAAAALAQLVTRAEASSNPINVSLDAAKAQLEMALGNNHNANSTAGGAAAAAAASAANTKRQQREVGDNGGGGSMAHQIGTQDVANNISGGNAAAATVRGNQSPPSKSLNNFVTQARSQMDDALFPILLPDLATAAAADGPIEASARPEPATRTGNGLPANGGSQAGESARDAEKPSEALQGPSFVMDNLIGGQPYTVTNGIPTLALQQPSGPAAFNNTITQGQLNVDNQGLADEINGNAAANGNDMQIDGSMKPGSDSEERENTPINSAPGFQRARTSQKVPMSSQKSAASQRTAASQKEIDSEKQGEVRGSWQLRKRRKPADTYEEDFAEMD